MMLPVKALKRRIIPCVLFLAALSAPQTARAAEDFVVDARLEGYADSVKVDAGSTALTWISLILLTVIGLAPLFKDAKRSHLD